MDHPNAALQFVFTEAAGSAAQDAGLPLHLEAAPGAPVPQVGDIVGVARGEPRTRFVVRSREFIWDPDAHGRAPQILLVLDPAEPGR